MRLYCKIPKIIVLTESQIREAMDGIFSFDELQSIRGFRGRMMYCRRHMGPPIGSGSSRIVFQIDDEKVLKLAKNDKGIAQNQVEADWLAQKYGVVPKLYDVADDDSYLVSEYVLPAKAADFKQCLGMTFKEFCGFVEYCGSQYGRKSSLLPMMNSEKAEELIENNEWLSDFNRYVTDYQLPVGDLMRIANYGLCKRNGKPQITLLDSGLTNDVYDSYYR